MVKVDSPVSRRIVHSFLDFLKSVEPAPGVDLEGLEVVRECLEDVFKLNPSSVDEQTQPGLLLKYFSSLDSNKQHESRSGQAVTFQNASSTSSTGDAQASPSHTANQQ
ncbi:Tetratricopeptide repeat (TPR)-like superfamily protein, partial [Thalictrum thalictroides]